MGNIRTVLTAQTDTARYAASFETAQRPKETALFTNIAQMAYPVSLIQNPAYPTDNTTVPNGQTSKLDGINKQLGATLALKVMAGDKVDIGVKAWVPFAATAPDGRKITTTQLLSGLINALTNGASGMSGGKATPTELQTTGSPMLTGIDDFLNGHNDLVYPSPPRAYLNWILFDEQFKYVPQGSGFIRVGYYDDLRMQTLAQNGLPIAKSGYLFVYLSNEVTGSETGINVFFDILTAQHYTGHLTEEMQYYPFGLAMNGISSKAFGRLENKKKFNGYEENKSFDLNWLESFYRTYDPQLGRFWQVDLKPNYDISLYATMGNNPILFIDILGDTLEFPGATDEFMQKFNDAKAYLVENGVGDLILDAERMKGKLKIIETSADKSYYDPEKKAIFWNPNKGADFENGVLISATTILNHEMDHAVNHFKNPKANEKRSNQKDKQYQDKEERRVITTFEQKTALALGEIKPGQVTRKNHGGHTFPTSNVRSTVHKHLDKVIEYRKRVKEIINSFQKEKPKQKKST